MAVEGGPEAKRREESGDKEGSDLVSDPSMLGAIETPALVLDLAKVERNVARPTRRL
jgi:hypothetical protein